MGKTTAGRGRGGGGGRGSKIRRTYIELDNKGERRNLAAVHVAEARRN